jgi:hypothetical protein
LIQAPLRFILDQLGGVFGFLVFERHGMDDAFDIMSGSLASGLFSEFGKRTGPGHEHVDHVATHGSRNAPKGAERDAVFGFGLLELLDGLSRCPHFLADLTLAKAKRLAQRSDPSSRGPRG